MTPNSMANKFASPTSLPPVVLIGITGGIASGKSYVCSQLEAAGHPVFYCDAEAKSIIRTDPAVRRELTALVGPEVYAADGQLVKSVLAAWLCRSRSHAAQVDAIVHPRVADAFAARAAAIASGAAPWTESEVQAATFLLQPSQRETDIAALAALPPGRVLFMECALLFEASFDRFVHRSVLVHVSHETQLRRLMARDQISQAQAQAWMDLQLSEEEKMARADLLLHND